jgi:hypothetical protein
MEDECVYRPCRTDYDVHFIFLACVVDEPFRRNGCHELREDCDIFPVQSFQKSVPGL